MKRAKRTKRAIKAKMAKSQQPMSAQGYAKLRKRALLNTYLANILALALCVTMLLGTTIAWFTSEVTNNGNQIFIGTLDVAAYVRSDVATYGRNTDPWVSLTSDDAPAVFDGNAFGPVAYTTDSSAASDKVRWEPGYTSIETLKIVNEGDLAFHYWLSFTMVVEDENGETETSVEPSPELLDIARFFSVYSRNETPSDDGNAPEAPGNFEDILDDGNGWSYVGTLDDILRDNIPVFHDSMDSDDVGPEGSGFKATEHIYSIAIHMNEDATRTIDGSNEVSTANSIMGKTIKFNIKLIASQMAEEVDEFNAAYDSIAPQPWDGESTNTTWYNNEASEFEISTAAQLAGLAKLVNEGNNFANKTIKLAKDIDLNEKNWTPIGNKENPFKGTFNGDGFTIYNLRVNNEYYASGLLGYNEGTIVNVNIVGATVGGNNCVGVIAGYTSRNITDCTVNNATVNCARADSSGETRGAGIIAGYVDGKATIVENEIMECTINANTDAGLIVGTAVQDTMISRNTATGCTLNNNENSDVFVGSSAESVIVNNNNIVTVPVETEEE